MISFAFLLAGSGKSPMDSSDINFSPRGTLQKPPKVRCSPTSPVIATGFDPQPRPGRGGGLGSRRPAGRCPLPLAASSSTSPQTGDGLPLAADGQVAKTPERVPEIFDGVGPAPEPPLMPAVSTDVADTRSEPARRARSEPQVQGRDPWP